MSHQPENKESFKLNFNNKNNLKYFTVENSLSQQELFDFTITFEYIKPYLQPPSETGSAKDLEDGTPSKINKAIFLNTLHPIPRFTKNLVRTYKHKIYNHPEVQSDPSSVYYNIALSDVHGHLISYYNEDNSQYKAHQDSSIITCLLWFFNGDKNFTGGELYLPDHDITIPCQHNTGIIFPSSVRHEVKPLKMINPSKDIGRITYTMFNNSWSPPSPMYEELNMSYHSKN
jgi:hypothetical protein